MLTKRYFNNQLAKHIMNDTITEKLIISYTDGEVSIATKELEAV